MIYVIQEKQPPHRLKLGFSKDAEKRIAVLSATLPQEVVILRVVEGDREDESFFHEHLKPYRVEGTREWYYPLPEVFEFLHLDNALDVAS